MIPKWFQIATTYLGTKEIKGKVNNSLIVKMFNRIKVGVTDDETPWCAAFVGNCLEEASIHSTRSAWALSYAKWGVSIPAPAVGAIAYMERKNSAGKVIGGHVTLVAGEDEKGNLVCLGGNQGDRVSLASFPRSRIMGYRWPASIALPLRDALPVIRMAGMSVSTKEA